ncbi:MAG TPA: AAA family ATPase, partial [Polyangiaceae bacterium]
MNNVGATHGSDEHRGRVVTFYSYKGGTGRTMALANVAWILASHGKRVMCVDWDLEAPGLHRYFAPFLADPELKETDGLIDWAYDYLLAATEASTSDELHEERDSSPWYNEFTQLDRYATSLSGDFPSGGALYLLGAGRQSSTFSERVNRFNWVRFYEEFGGEAFVNASFENARKLYDYILVDSRTGVADTSGVSTIQVPDDLVVALTLNNQSIYGAAHVAQVAL